MSRLRVGAPWRDSAHERRNAVLAARRALRTSADPPQTWPSLAEFYAGRGVLVTGGSGFMGRVLVEFLLRCCPDVGTVFLILRARRGVSPAQRLKQLTDVALFDRLRREQPAALSKVVVVSGDVALPGLGLSAEDRTMLTCRVSVVFHCAASVRFDDPFRKAVFTNLRSTRDLIQLAREMPELKVFVHVSTAYAVIKQNEIREWVYPGHLDWREVIRWAEGLPDADVACVDHLDHKLRDFQPNTYTLTKALAERLVEEEGRDLPAIITRPSIVISSFEDPLPGWVDNLNGPMALFVAGLKGVLRITPMGDAVMDTVPVDVATKIILLASWLKGIGKPFRSEPTQQGAVDVVNVTVGNDLGPTMADYREIMDSEMIERVSCPNSVRWPYFTYYPNGVRYKLYNFYFHTLYGIVVDTLARLAGTKPRLLQIYRVMATAFQALGPFVEDSFTFEMRNQEFLHSAIHPSDEKNLCYLRLFSIRDDRAAFQKVTENTAHGLFKYLLREEITPAGYQLQKKLFWVDFIYHFAMLAVFCGIVYALIVLRLTRWEV